MYLLAHGEWPQADGNRMDISDDSPFATAPFLLAAPVVVPREIWQTPLQRWRAMPIEHAYALFYCGFKRVSGYRPFPPDGPAAFDGMVLVNRLRNLATDLFDAQEDRADAYSFTTCQRVIGPDHPDTFGWMDAGSSARQGGRRWRRQGRGRAQGLSS